MTMKSTVDTTQNQISNKKDKLKIVLQKKRIKQMRDKLMVDQKCTICYNCLVYSLRSNATASKLHYCVRNTPDNYNKGKNSKTEFQS